MLIVPLVHCTAPTAVVDLLCSQDAVNLTQIICQWTAPIEANGIIQRYGVVVRDNDNNNAIVFQGSVKVPRIVIVATGVQLQRTYAITVGAETNAPGPLQTFIITLQGSTEAPVPSAFVSAFQGPA